ncbi:MAG: sugar phosphate isomerase/epimerase [Devosia sp.]|nr:sugar phosphate isomerase/epimerase [Devosia sp.]
MPSPRKVKFGAELVTFFHPGYWGVAAYDEIVALSQSHPVLFWDKILDGVAAAGVAGVELTFSPFHWQEAVAAYSSLGGLTRALETRGLSLSSGFFAELEHGSDLLDPSVQQDVIERAARYAELIGGGGGEAMVIGLPMRQTPGSEPPAFVDLALAQRLADFLNRLGATTARHNVKLALHTEAHSMFAMSRDIDLFLLLTDPAYVGFCPDTAHMVVAGADPIEVVRRHHERVVIAHWKDAIGPMPPDTPIDAQIHERHRPYFCRLGAGRVDWPAWARLMRDIGFSGWAILELDAAADPVGDIIAGRQFIETALLPIFA